MEAQGSGRRGGLSKQRKVIVVAAAVALVVSGTAFVWYEYLRYWTVEDVAEAVAGNEASPGFKESLANKTVEVKGTVTNITSSNTTLGPLFLVELDDFELMHFVFWDAIDFGIGDELVTEVSFEWSRFNAEAHVYSPQLDFPALSCVMGIEMAMFSESFTWDIYWEPLLEDDTATVTFDWVAEEVPLGECNCSVSAGEFSWAVEYVDILGDHYGAEVGWAESLSSVVDSGGDISYEDADGDGSLSSGDSLSIRGLDVPDCESGVQCYEIKLGMSTVDYESWSGRYYLPMYLPVMKQGVLRSLDPARNYVCLDVTDLSNGFRLEVAYAAYPVLWSDSSALLYSVDNTSDIDDPDIVWIDPFAEGLDTGSEATWSSGPVFLGTLAWNVSVTDVEGDGAIGAGDYAVLECDVSDIASVLEYLMFRLVCEPTGVSLANQAELIDTSD